MHPFRGAAALDELTVHRCMRALQTVQELLPPVQQYLFGQIDKIKDSNPNLDERIKTIMVLGMHTRQRVPAAAACGAPRASCCCFLPHTMTVHCHFRIAPHLSHLSPYAKHSYHVSAPRPAAPHTSLPHFQTSYSTRQGCQTSNQKSTIL